MIYTIGTRKDPFSTEKLQHVETICSFRILIGCSRPRSGFYGNERDEKKDESNMDT